MEVNNIIMADREVYAKAASLSEAKKIVGIRAMFSETYPDPVRIISVGSPVTELIKNPDGKGALETSVEFCGGTHLHRSSHIGEFIITNEEAIAKGIRRIIAITGPDAVKSRAHADALESACKILRSALDLNTLSKENALSAINDHLKDISDASIAYYKKDELRCFLKSLKKKIDDDERISKNEQMLRVVDEAKSVINQAGSDELFIVARLNAGSNTKALDAALKQIKKTIPQIAAMFFSSDEESKKIFCLCNVPQNLIQLGLKANEWVNNISTMIGGKSGGKDDAAQASGNNSEVMNDAIKASVEFATEKLNISNHSVNNTPKSLFKDTPTITYAIHNPASVIPAIALQYSGINVQENYDEKLCYLDKNVKLTDPTAIAFLLSNEQLKGGSLLAEAQIIQWVSYIESTIHPAIWTVLSSIKDKSKTNLNKVKLARENLLECLNKVNHYLENCTYLVGENITLADITVFARVFPAFQSILSAEEKHKFTNINRWYETIRNQPPVQRVVTKMI